jgi:DNA polymerase-3 subunit chi
MSTEIRFYHMERSGLEQTLPMLVTKALQNNHKIIIKSANENDIERLNEHLWSYDPASFIPHGTSKDGPPENQPVFLTTKDENPNGADVLILAHGATHENLKDFTLICEMLNGNDPQSIDEARARWKTYKEEGFETTYWQQGTKGGWEKKA